MTDGSRVAGEPNVFRSMWDHRGLIVLVAALFAVAGVLVNSLRPATYAAEAGLLLEDPRLSIDAQTRPARDEVRYVADQVAILKSVAAAEGASKLTRTKERPQGITALDLRRETVVRTSEGSNYIAVRFSAGDPETAQLGANAISRAYRQLVREDVETEIKAALSRLDIAIASATAAYLKNPTQSNPALGLLNELRERRNELQVDAELRGDGVALASAAGLGKRQGASLLSTLVVALVLGGLIGTGLAYVLDSWAKRRPGSHAAFDAPPLAEIPDFDREQLSSRLPVVDAPDSRSAEAFRFLAAVVGLPRASFAGPAAAGSAESLRAEFANRSVAFIAASTGDGTTTIAANSALAAAQAGDRVLLLDGDLRGHDLTRLMLDGQARVAGGAGFTDMLLTGALPQAIVRVETDNGGSVTLVEPGSATLDAMNAIRPERIRANLESTRGEFDRVFIDVPALLELPYAEALVSGADSVVTVVPHHGDENRVEQFLERLDAIGVRPIGHVYNLVPLRVSARRRAARALFGRGKVNDGRSRRQPSTTLSPVPASRANPTVREPVDAQPATQEASLDEQSVSPGRRWA